MTKRDKLKVIWKQLNKKVVAARVKKVALTSGDKFLLRIGDCETAILDSVERVEKRIQAYNKRWIRRGFDLVVLDIEWVGCKPINLKGIETI